MARIKLHRGLAHRPLTRRHKRNLAYAFMAAAVFSIWYIWSAPIDPFSVSWSKHEAYMNDRSHMDGFVAKSSYDWRKAPFFNKPKSYIPLPAGKPKTLPRIQFQFPPETRSHKALREQRRIAVRNEFERSWDSYKKFAWTHDELAPESGTPLDPFGGWGATIVDSLDTLWIMGFKRDFYEAVEAVAMLDFGSTNMSSISVFETTIRYLGGLLSAYDLSHEKVLLEKAIQMGEMLYRAFDTTNNLPSDRLSLEAAKEIEGTGRNPESQLCFAGLASLTMEFTRLTQITQQPKYYDAVARVTALLDRAQNTTRIPGLFPTYINAAKEDFMWGRTFTIGAMADSSYEYFPKMHALLGGLEPVYQKLYRDSAAMIDKHMLFRPLLPDPERSEELLYCGDVSVNDSNIIKLDPEYQHLTCFIGGFFALAGRLFKNHYHVDLGAKLTEGCIFAYESMPTGIMPEIFDMAPCDSRISCPWNATKWEQEVLRRGSVSTDDFETGVKKKKLPKGFTSIRDKRYLLRPEAIESVFIMYRITGHDEYLEHAWNMFRSIRKYSRTRFANGQVFDVTADNKGGDPPLPEDKMESFWLAETLKYFYLIFSPPDMIDLDDWVFNTEAHPFRRPKWVKLEAGRQH